jgi:rod shape-determining protein MreC
MRLDHRAVAAWKTLLHGLLYAGLVFAAMVLMMVGKANGELMERIRTYVSDAFAPLLDIMSRPVDIAVDVAQALHEWQALSEENAALRLDRERLLRWQDAARHLEAENTQLRQLLNLVPDPDARFVTARVLADNGSAFARSLIVGAGLADGVAKGQAVLAGAGFVGRIAGVAKHSAHVLLVTDLNFKIPVVVGEARIRAILAGDNSDRPKLTHLGPDTFVAVGDRVVTSGHADAFPADLPIGSVASIVDGTIRVKLFAQGAPIDYVRIVDYGLRGIIDSALSPFGCVGTARAAPARRGGTP